MELALTLLLSATQLLTLATGANIPESFKQSAIEIAQQAIVIAHREINNAQVLLDEPVLGDDRPLILENGYGIRYIFEDKIINRRRIQDLVNAGFYSIEGELPGITTH